MFTSSRMYFSGSYPFLMTPPSPTSRSTFDLT